MRSRYFRIAITLLLFAPVVSRANDQGLVNTYRYLTASVSPMRVDYVHVWLGKQESFVDGTLSRLPVYADNPNDYLEIIVIGPDGKILATKHTGYFPKPAPCPSPRFGRTPCFYGIKLDFIPPPASTIKVVYERFK